MLFDRKTILVWSAFCASLLSAQEPPVVHEVNFSDVSAAEFIRYVGRMTQTNFIYDPKELDFPIHFVTGRPVTAEQLFDALDKILRVNGYGMAHEDGYWVIAQGLEIEEWNGAAMTPEPVEAIPPVEFYMHKLQYHEGSAVEPIIKQMAADLSSKGSASPGLLEAIHSLQWVPSTNSLICSGNAAAIVELRTLIDHLDQPLKQVFIEILVVETDAQRTSDFGLDWAMGGRLLDNLGGGASQVAQSTSWADAVRNTSPAAPPTGLNQLPMGGFDMGVIGNLVRHKGQSYFTLGALVSALQRDGDAAIVLNQKIITQDNKNSKIFCGDNLPFTGSVVQTVGVGQQTTSHIDYRDVGVSLNITPRLGNGDVITLEIEEEISESLGSDVAYNGTQGIRTTKTNMATYAHVPDRHFLILSGMMRNVHSVHKEGLPWLSRIPYVGGLFGKTRKKDAKRSIIIFVRPHIIRSFDEYQTLSDGHRVAAAPLTE